MEPNRFEVYTLTDRARRDELFRDYRINGTPNERQVVKFSGVEPVMEGGEQKVAEVRYSPTGRIQKRFVWRSTWSVAYPMERA